MKRFTAIKAAMVIACSFVISGSLFAASAAKSSKVKIVKCNPKAASSFAIFADEATYSACKEEINAYRDILQSEGLGTYIITSDWAGGPDDVKAQIIALSKRKPALEGMVFIGDIPIARIRRAQFMTTAFKMNENTFPIEESSVTSDRFYDDLNLTFSFIGRDSANTNQYYYNLTSKGAVRLNPTFYSARILVPEEFPGDKTETLKKYLKKVVAAHKEVNALDNMIFFAGHGYNSDCLTAWHQQPLAFKESFPDAFKSSETNKFYNFRQRPYMKFELFNEVQRPETDLFLFYEHGAPETQYINGEYPADDYASNIELFKRNVRAAYKRAARKSQEKADKLIEEVCKEYNFRPEAFSKEAMAAERRNDSLDRADINIVLKDIEKLKTGAKMVIFNACYNGSFHQPGYVAGYHIFNDGNCILTQGNTVNVLQDKWADQLIGLLALGVRAGFWQKEITFLESHLVGDPTLRFSPRCGKEMAEKLSKALIDVKAAGADFWRSLLAEKDPVLKSLAIKKLNTLKAISTEELEQIFKSSDSWIVRHQVLWAIVPACDEHSINVVKLALNDPYEMIRRQACNFAGNMGNDEFFDLVFRMSKNQTDSYRLAYQSKNALMLFNPATMLEEAKSDKSLMSWVNRMEKGMKTIMDNSQSKERRESAIRSLRNNPCHSQVPDIIRFAQDSTQSEYLRLIMIEAMGWFNCSYRREELASALSEMLTKEKLSPRMKDEVEKSIKRLRWE